MNKKVLKNFVYQAMYQVTVIILPIITVPIVSHSLGAQGIGTYNYITSIVSYFVLISGLGLANYGIREIASVKNSMYDRSKKFWELEFFNIAVVICVMLIYCVFLIYVPQKLYFYVSGITLLAALFDITWFYYGVQDFKQVTLVNICIKMLSFFSIMLFINDKNDLLLYFIIQSTSILLSNISLLLFLKGKIVWVPVSFNSIFSHFRPALSFFIGKVSITLYTTLNKTLLGIFVTTTAVGLYSNSLQLITMSVVLIGVLDTVLMPYMTELYVNNKEEELLILMEKTIDIQLFFSIPIMFGLMLINAKIVPWFYGEEFTYLLKIVPILAPLVVVMPLGISIVRQFLMPKNNIKEFNLSVVYAAIVSIVANLILLPLIGIWGSIIATLLSELVVTVVRVISLLKNSEFRFKLTNISIYILSSVIMYVMTKKMTLGLDATMKTTLIQILYGTIIYMLITLVFKKNIIFTLLIKRRNRCGNSNKD